MPKIEKSTSEDMMQNDLYPSLLSANIIELHYWFDDDTHSIDAVVQNKCESELLALFKEIASPLNAAISIETFPIAKGGVRRSFKMIPKKDTARGHVRTAFLSALASDILISPLSAPLTPVINQVKDKFFDIAVLEVIKSKKLRNEIEKLQYDIQKCTDHLNRSTVVKKRKSNFYDLLDRYQKVNRISFSVENSEREKLINDTFVERQSFNSFVLTTDNLDPVQDDNAEIEIISPVLKQGNYRWVGLYKGSAVSFNMKSEEFKGMVQNGQVQFRNGTSIRCTLQIRKKIDSEGLEKVTGYDVLDVHEYFESGKPVVTLKVRKPKVQKETAIEQLSLFELF